MTDIPNWLFQQFGPAAGYTFPLPVLDVDPDADPLVYIRMNRDWLAYVIAACMPLTLLETWRETDGATLALVTQRAHLLIDMLMTILCDPLCVGSLRLAGNTLQYSPDGGATWQNINNAGSEGNPADPRTDEPLLPHRTGSNIPCLAAANATAVFVELHRELSNWYASNPIYLSFLYSIGAALQGFFQTLWSVFGLKVDIADLATNILAFQDSLNEAAFTTEIQDALTCILFCHADSDGQWDQTAFDALLLQIAAQSGDMWSLIGIYIEQVSGIRGLNNAGVTTSVATHSCAGCGCGWCYESDFTVSADSWACDVVPGSGRSFGSYSAGVGFVGEVFEDQNLVWIHRAFTLTYLTKIVLTASIADPMGGTGENDMTIRNGDLVVFAQLKPVSPGTYEITWTGGDNWDEIWLQDYNRWAGNTVITKVHIEGQGTCPFGTPNC